MRSLRLKNTSLPPGDDAVPLVFENAGTRLGFATNWKEKPVPLELSWPDGTRETSLLAPRETILLTQPQG